MKTTPEQLIANALIGKKIKSFEFGSDESERQGAIGKKIDCIRFGWDEARDSTGLLIYYADGKNCAFVYSNEEIEVE